MAGILNAFVKSPLFIREQLFWTKFEAFLNGVYLNSDDCIKLRAILTENGTKRDNALRLVESIDRAETQQKIQFLINATRSLLADDIDKPMYFRICHAITHTLEEDLIFLSEHIFEKDLTYSEYVQGLLLSGLMYQSVFDANNEHKYSFTSFAEIVDQYAVSYENMERYQNHIQPSYNLTTPQIKLPGPEWGEFT